MLDILMSSLFSLYASILLLMLKLCMSLTAISQISLASLIIFNKLQKPTVMQSIEPSNKNPKGIVIPEDISSRKTKSYHKGNKSQRNNSSQKRNAFERKETPVGIATQRSNKQQKNNRNHSVKQSKCNSDHEYHLLTKVSKVSQEVDGKTEINKQTIKMKNKQLEEELQHAEMVRQGLVNSNDRKIKISSRRRQVISHDILHPPITLLSTKQKKQEKKEGKMAQISLTQSERLDDKEYDEIVKEVKLNNLESKIISNPQAQQKKQQYFLSKIQQSQSELISSPLHQKNTFHFTPTASPELKQSVTNHINITNDKSLHSPDKSLFKMDSIEQEAINQSVERTFKQKEVNNEPHGNIRINPCKSDEEEEKITQKRSNNKVEQSKVFITTKVGSVKSNKKVQKQSNKLTLVTGTIEENIKIQQKKDEQEEKKRLNEEINFLKSAVRELKLEKIKARAQLNMTIDVMEKDARQQPRSRYETLNATISQKAQERQSNSGVVIFGKIKKNRSLSRKKGNYSMKSHELTAQKQLDLPDPLINPNKFSFISQKKIAHDTVQPKQYKTMNLQRINEENMEQSLKFQGNFTTSVNIPTFGSELRSNKINMRGIDICNDVLNKFQSSDRKFKNFINLSSSKSRIKSLKGDQGQKRLTEKSSFPSESSQPLQNAFDGVILRNKAKVVASLNINEAGRGIQLQSGHLIKEGEKIELIKSKRQFQLNKVPQIPQNPTYSTPTQDIMQLILKVLPYSNIQYQPQDLEDCILKKYKNCIMFELKRFPLMKMVWYYNGKLYIGEWNTAKNEKNGFGKEFSKDKHYYEGDFRDNKRSGVGSFVSEGILYEGEWVDGEKHGIGKFLDLNDSVFYQGEWKCDQRHGKGHFQSQTGIYYGMFSNDIKDGFGIQLFKNGDRYIGFYSNGKFQGQGKYLWYNRSFYLGNFNAGFRQGLGKWQSGPQNYELYIGQFLRDKKQGTGKYIWSNRCVYEGHFFNDLKHGLGNVLYPDGRYMQGVWTQGILTEVISKVTQANKEEPLEEPRSRNLHSKTFIRVIDPL